MFRWRRELSCIMKVARKNILPRWLLSGILLGTAFVYPLFWPLAIVGGAYFLYLSEQKQSRKSLIFGSWLAWTIKSLLAMVWFWSTYPIEWLPAEFAIIQIPVIGIYWLLASLTLGSGGVLLAVFVRWSMKTTKKLWLRYSPVPFVWSISEVIGTLVFSIVFIGPGVPVNLSSTSGYVGYLMAENDWLLQLAVYGGVYALTIVFAILSLFILFITKTKSSCCMRLGTINLLVLVLIIFLADFEKQMDLLPEDTPYYSVVTIDTNFPHHRFLDSEESAKVAEEFEKAMAAALETEPDYIILPEDSRYFDRKENPAVVRSMFSFKYARPDTVIVDTSRVELTDSAILKTFIYNGSNEVEQVDKNILVPLGEYTPYVFRGLYWLTGYNEKLRTVTKDISFVVGRDTDQSEMAEGVPGVLFCSESLYPRGVKRILNDRPDAPFVAHPISHAWFHDPLILWHQLESMLKVQAVWNRTFIVSAGNHVDGKVTTPDGEVENLKIIAEGEMWRVKATKIPVLE